MVKKQKLPPRGTGLILGTARTGLQRGKGRPLTDIERMARHKRIYGQAISRPIRTRILKAFPRLCQFPMVMKVMKGL